MRLTRFRLLLVSLVAALLVVPSPATVLLKPSGGPTMALRTKSISADVRITGQFAATTQTLVFVNENEDRIEADFLYTLPPRAVATYFAYWAGDEKVVARIVEKERAAEIYKTITTRQRDPALIELVGKNTFRARIFPVMPNADLKVEIRFVQPLPSDAAGATYTLPLFEGKKSPTLDSIDVKVRIVPDDDVTSVTNNFGIPVKRASDGYSVAFSGSSYRPQKDLRIQLKRSPAPLRASLYSAPSGGGDGFFALALTPAHAVSRPKVTIGGVRTYDVLPIPKSAKANEAIVLFGRYKGSGAATVTLGGVSEQVRFGSQSEPNNPATKLWAAAKIEQLGSNRAKVLALSKRYTLPSKYTSWLAVPKAEMELYRREKAEAEAYSTAKQLAELLANDHHSTGTEKLLRARLNASCKVVGLDPKGMLNDAIGSISDSLGWELTDLIADGRDKSARGQHVRRLYNRLQRAAGNDPKDSLRYHLRWRMDDAARDLVDARHAKPLSRTRIASLQARLHRLESASGTSAKQVIEEYERPYVYEKSERVRADLLRERAKKNPGQARISALDKEFIAINTRLKNRSYALARSERLRLNGDLDKIDGQTIAANRAGDAARQAELEKQQTKLADRIEELRVRMGDPLIAVEAPADARQVVAVMPDGTVMPLKYDAKRGRWEARFNVPAYAREGDYVITVIVTLKDGTQEVLKMRYTVDLTPPAGTAQARMVSDQRKLRLEVDADADTARVVALTPWGGRIEVQPSSAPHRFFALVPVPEGSAGAGSVTFILTDGAHNRTVITEEVRSQ